MWLIFVFFVFILLFVLSAALTLVSRVLGGIFGLFGAKRAFQGSSYGQSSNGSNESSSPLVRSELGTKRMRQFKELAQETEFVEEKIENQ
ncbi:MAG: hypothetical protein MJZ33_00620 [Paludibacteraceae bacterium]|nr:hypothetical protein [Paludibacteraceae bacterium]